LQLVELNNQLRKILVGLTLGSSFVYSSFLNSITKESVNWSWSAFARFIVKWTRSSVDADNGIDAFSGQSR